MSAIDEYRRKLAQIGTEAMAVIGMIADAETKLDDLKAQAREVYEEIDNSLDRRKE